jgi:hypothetical protein
MKTAHDYNAPTRFRPGQCPNPHGRPSIQWLRQKVEVVDPQSKQTKLQEMADHLIEVATSWEVRVVGRDSDGELLKVASASDSVNACKLIWQALSLLRRNPPSEDEISMNLAEHFRVVAHDQFDVMVRMLGDRLKTMSPGELAEYWRACDRDPRRYVQAAEEELAARAEGLPVRAGGVAEQRGLNEHPASGDGGLMAAYPPSEQVAPVDDGGSVSGSIPGGMPSEDLEPMADARVELPDEADGE